MPEAKDLMEHALRTATAASPPPSDEFDRFVRYRDRRRRNQRLAAGALAMVLAVAVIGSVLTLLRTSDEGRPGSSGRVVELDPGLNQVCGPSDACWDADVFTMNVDGTDVTRLGLDAERDFGYSWSPDGERIAIYRGVGVEGGGRFDAVWDVLTMAVDGTDVQQLTEASGVATFPVYSPDGSKIAYMGEAGDVADVWVMNADGSDPVNLTAFDDSRLDDYHPAWSPDGERIAFVRGKTPPGGPGKLWVVDADGSNGHVLLDEPLAMFPSWSPDGTRIAFGTGDWPDVRVQVLDLADGSVTDVVAGHLPRWSPDGTRLLVTVPTGSGGFGIVDLDAPNRLELLRSTGWGAAWSPDGQQILFNDAGLTATEEPTLEAPPPGDAIAGFTESGIPFLVVRHEDGTLTAVEAVSPHLAAGNVPKLLGWCASSRTFDDKFHGARFDEQGRYISGPSPTGLVPLAVEVVTDEPLTFRLGELQPAIPREETGEAPVDPLCTDLETTPLVAPGIAASGLTPLTLAASSPHAGSRWSVEGTLVLRPSGEMLLCASYVDGTCEAVAIVSGPVPEGDEELVIDGTWYVLVQDGVLADPIRAA